MFYTEIGREQKLGLVFLALAMAVVVGSALAFEYIGGYVPCNLCLQQREPYYLGVPIALIGALGAYLRWPSCVARGALILVALLLAYGLVLGIYHAGVEWAWWMGPADCSTSSTTGLTTDANDLLGALDTIKPPSCDEAAGRFLGLSFAGWNVIASLVLLVVAIRVAFSTEEE